jgi:hypothetical protein
MRAWRGISSIFHDKPGLQSFRETRRERSSVGLMVSHQKAAKKDKK